MLTQSFLASGRTATARYLLIMLGLCVVLALLPVLRTALPAATPAAATDLGSLPLRFLPTGDPAMPFAAFGASGMGFQPGGVALALPAGKLQVRFLGARADAVIQPAERQAGVFNRMLGSDPARWQRNLPVYAALDYLSLYPGIDLRYDGLARQLKGTYTLAPYADPAAIRWQYAGAQHIALDPARGALQITLADHSTLTEHAPIAWQIIRGQQVPVDAHFVLTDGVASFALGGYDASQPLVIDPALELGTYLGGSGADFGRGIAVDAQGNIYVVGDYFSNDFLGNTTAPSGSKDVILLKLNPQGNDLVYGTVLGGSSSDEGLALAVNPAGEAFMLVDPGADFPIRNAPVSQPPDLGDGILVKFNAAGDLLYSTYLGFAVSNLYTVKALAFDHSGALYVAGESYIAIQRLRELAIGRFDPATGAASKLIAGQDRFSGSRAAAITVAADDTIYMIGSTDSRFSEDFPTTPDAFQALCGRKLMLGTAKDCDSDAFVMAFNSDLSVRYASYLGGSGDDRGAGISLDAAGNILMAGPTTSPDFPLKQALQPTCPQASTGGCPYDSFVAKLAAGGGALIYSTYLASEEGSNARVTVTDVAADADGNAYVYGYSNSKQLPIKDAIQPNLATGVCLGAFDRFCFDAFVTKLAPDGQLLFSSYLGGKLDEISGSMALDRSGALYLIGYTEAADFPVTAGSIQPKAGLAKEFFVAKLRLSGSTVTPGLARHVYLPIGKR